MSAIDNLKQSRRKAGLRLADYAIALGYRSSDRHNLRQQVYDMESGRKDIPPWIERLAIMYSRYGVPKAFLAPRDYSKNPETGQKENETE